MHRSRPRGPGGSSGSCGSGGIAAAAPSVLPPGVRAPGDAMPHTVTLQGPSPWGFRLVGGKDFSTALTISRINPGSKAALANLCPGDVIQAINGENADSMTHLEAQNKIKACLDQLTLSVNRTEGKTWSSGSPDDGKAQAYRINIDSEPQDNGFTHSRRSSASGGSLADSKTNLGLQYGTPSRLYSHNNEASLQAQMSNLHVSPPHSSADSTRSLPRSRNGIDVESDVYKMLQEYGEPASEPKQSGSFRYLQGMLEAGENGEKLDRAGGPRNLKSPVSKLGGPMGSLQLLPECTRCGNGIVGTIVKARDKLYHPECFMCSDCGLNLKQRGYFFIEERLYCETHAKARVKPPEGYDVVAVYPNAKVELV
ncbi:PDZ and LIM domain protein 4 isoform X1 [Antechinus flavipes]|uniref:PDZ and LIM domain protein 4 n=1 Tax=Sarcophilus harrisii TaxID=9305 RepID=A0A7N4PP68_SARHA|nr:PDZ and LIM domain protein 4 isoform X2 [Sarcophilus harrisii]XP_051834186.1 PDZ and LIM domain protein 4 isoform X1 [Antechinus flavipes]